MSVRTSGGLYLFHFVRLMPQLEIAVCDAMPCYTAFLCNIYGFYSRGIIMMVLRGVGCH